MKIPPLICLIILSLLCSCNSLTGVTSVKPNDNGNLIVPLTIGKDIIYGVFDTGSTGSCLTGEEADEYDISLSGRTVRTSLPDVQGVISCPLSDETEVKYGTLAIVKDIKLITKFAVSDSFKQNIWGMDIIGQVNWLFDFEKSAVMMSTAPIPCDTADAVVLKYRVDDQKRMVCDMKHGDTVLNDVLIDTGMSEFNPIGVSFSIYRLVSNPGKEEAERKSMGISQTVLSQDQAMRCRLGFENSDTYGVPLFWGPDLTFDAPDWSITAEKIKAEFPNGILALSYGCSRKLYIETTTQRIFLIK